MDVRDGSRPLSGWFRSPDPSHCRYADQVNWAPATNLPAGWQITVLVGDPAQAGPYVQRVKLPPNAAVPPRAHPDGENITVLSGSFGIGEGEVADQAKGRVLPAG